MIITGIIEREIRKTGAFKDKLGDYAFSFSRTEQIDPARAETILRDLFKARTGMTMNQMREGLAEREKQIGEEQYDRAYQCALAVGTRIEQGDKITLNRAFAEQAEPLGRELDITDAGAKRLMKDAFKDTEGTDLYDWGKELEEWHFRPQIEAEKQAREKASREDGRSSSETGNDRKSRFSRAANRNSGDGETTTRRRSFNGPRP